MLFRSGMTTANEECSILSPGGDTWSLSSGGSKLEMKCVEGESRRQERCLFRNDSSWERRRRRGRWGLRLRGGLRMESERSVDLPASKSLSKFAEGGSKFIAIFHWETPVMTTGPAAKYDHGSFRCKVCVNMSSSGVHNYAKCKSLKPQCL